MKRAISLISITLFLVLVASATFFSQDLRGSTIQGHVFDAADRRPIADVYVELLSDTYSTLKRIRTDGSGRYYFNGLSQGSFKVKVRPFGTNYQEEVQDAELVGVNRNGRFSSVPVYLDFYLKPDKRKAEASTTTGAVFVQDIPAEAKASFVLAVSQLERERDADLGIQNLKKALEIFPDYYDALNRISFEYVRRDKFYESLPHLVRAVGINPRSFSCHFMLGTAAYNLKHLTEAGEAFRITTVISPQSVIAHVKYGMVLRISGDHTGAEKMLLKAVSLSKEFPEPEGFWQLALLYDKLERFGEAAQNLEKYLENQPDVENKNQIKKLINSMKAKAGKAKPA